MIVICERALAIFKGPGCCECCGRPVSQREPHHVFLKRGFGGGSRLDLPINLAALGGAFDCGCHHKAEHSKEFNVKIMEKVAAREGRTVDSIFEELWGILNLPKGSELP